MFIYLCYTNTLLTRVIWNLMASLLRKFKMNVSHLLKAFGRSWQRAENSCVVSSALNTTLVLMVDAVNSEAEVNDGQSDQ